MAYIIAIAVGWQDRTYAIPVLAVVLNCSWELIQAFWWPPRQLVTRVMYRAWFLLDVLILAEVVAFGAVTASGKISHGFFGLVLAGTALAVFAQVKVHLKWRSPELVAFAMNAAMSILFIAMYFGRPNGEGISVWLAITKLLGTGCISLANILMMWRTQQWRPWLLWLTGIITVADLAYVALVVKGR